MFNEFYYPKTYWQYCCNNPQLFYKVKFHCMLHLYKSRDRKTNLTLSCILVQHIDKYLVVYNCVSHKNLEKCWSKERNKIFFLPFIVSFSLFATNPSLATNWASGVVLKNFVTRPKECTKASCFNISRIDEFASFSRLKTFSSDNPRLLNMSLSFQAA